MNETNFTIYEWASSIIDIPEHKIKEVTHDFGIWFSHIKEETSQELVIKEIIKLTNLNKMRIIRKLKYKINKCNLKNIICLWHKALNVLETKPLIFIGLFQVEKHPSVFVCVFLFWLLVFGFFMLIIIIIELISLLPELILSICNTLKKFFKRPLLAVFRILKSLN